MLKVTVTFASDSHLFARQFKPFLALSAIPYLIGRISLAYTPRIPALSAADSRLIDSTYLASMLHIPALHAASP